MSDRALGAGAVVVVAICCGVPALAGGLLAGVVASTLARTTVLGVVGLAALAAAGVFVARRRCSDRGCAPSRERHEPGGKTR